MATKSNNTQGNPYHDDEGKFTSADDNGSGNSSENGVHKIKLTLKEDAFSNTSSTPEIKPSAEGGTKLKLKQGLDFNEIKEKIAQKQSVYDMPYFQSADDIVNNIDKMFIKSLVEDLDNNYRYGQCNPYSYSPFKFSDGDEGLKINMFVQLLSQYRYPQKYCDTISAEEFNHIVGLINSQGSGKFSRYSDDNLPKGYLSYRSGDLDALARDTDLGCGYVMGYRGIAFHDYNWKQKLNEALNSYIGYHTDGPIYSSGGCYGTVNYVAMSRNYAYDYDGYRGHIMKHIIDTRKAKIMYQPQVERIKGQLISRAGEIQDKLEQHFGQYLPPDRAHQLAQGVVGSIRYDFGFTCVLMGGDCVVAGIGNGNQMDILNWNVAKILKDW